MNAALLLLLGCPGTDPKPDPDEAEPTSLAEAWVTVRGDAGDLAGSAVTAGDLDGDGAGDLVVAGLGGRVTCVWPGPVSGELLLRGAPTCLGQAEDYDFAGYAIASGVDLDGDGADELLVGGPAFDGGDDATGAVWLLDGPLSAGTPSVADTERSWVGLAAGDALGTAVAFAGDQDGDGVEEVLLGAPKSDAGARDEGAVFLVSPMLPAATLVHATLAVFVGGGAPAESPAKHADNVTGDGVGNAACRAGDLDGDGFDDVVIAAPGWDGGAEDGGAVAVFAGPVAEGTWGVADAGTLLLGTTAGAYLGGAVACGGDTDGDGHGELLVGADADGGGRAWLWRGGALADATRFVGSVTNDQAGYAVAFVPAAEGDVVAIGAPSADGVAVDSGRVALFRAPGGGTHDLADAEASWGGEGAGDLAGTAMVGLADLDGAGTPGLLVGAPYNRDGAPIGGAAYGIPAP